MVSQVTTLMYEDITTNIVLDFIQMCSKSFTYCSVALSRTKAIVLKITKIVHCNGCSPWG